MSVWRIIGGAVACFSVATILAEAGLLAVLGQRGLLNPRTLHNLLIVAYEIPIHDIHDQLAASRVPARQEMVSFQEIQEARLLTALDLDLRQMSSEKGLMDMLELEVLLSQEKGRYSVVKDQFDDAWENLRKGASDSALQNLKHQIESLHPKAAKAQLLLILDSPDVPAETALHQVVAIFKNLAIDKRKKILSEFKESDSPRLQEILRQIRLGMPEVELLQETRVKLQEFRTPE